MPPFRALVSRADGQTRSLGNVALLPLRQTTKGSDRGPAPPTHGEDIVDQSLNLFKANILFKQFEMESDVDRVLVYVTLYTIECLKRLQKCTTQDNAMRDMYTAALESFHLPGEAGFPLNAFYTKPNPAEADELKRYLTQIRQETGARLAGKVFDQGLAPEGGPSKWWTCFAKRKFLNVSLSQHF